ncbi:MauE/DoxX family redox-associated membrane protein [Niabella soli]|uniref:DoxX family protein n=1 Tax=Niabella soli DSM 19437 TaxID=929713 RepID=W0F3C8_9BACT|nr:MauE/DoxX family redox-associated membrane protein [Niabella soli]AHF16293.1 DoxX family protein [Niabella soli DSM 19437]
MKIVKQIVFTLFALVFLNAGLSKFFHYMPAPEMTPEQMELMGAVVKIKWLMPLTGTIEILGGLLVIFPKTRALGALVILPVMTGILVHGITLAPDTIVLAGTLMLINIWMILDNYKRYRPILA